jgi:hypothetical protein
MPDDSSAVSDPKGDPAPVFDAKKTGLRKRGEKGGAPAITVAKGDVVEAFWSVQHADIVQLMRDGESVGEPDRASDQLMPLPLMGLDPGEYTFKLVGGVSSHGKYTWASEGVELKISLKPALSVTKFWGDPEPDDDDKDHPPHDLQVATGHKVKLHWETAGAKQVVITATPRGASPEELDPQDASSGQGELVVDPGGKPTTYSIVAVNGQARSKKAGPVSVEFHAKDEAVSTQVLVQPVGGAAALEVYAFDENPDEEMPEEIKPGGGYQVKTGAEDEVKLKWAVAAAKSARLTARFIEPKELKQEQPKPGDPRHASNLSILQHGLDLPLDAQGAGADLVTVHPGPANSTEYTLEVTPLEGAPFQVQASAMVANFNVELRMPDGSPAANKECTLEVRGHGPFKGRTMPDGELWMNLPRDLESPLATLRLLDGGEQIASWIIDLDPEPV